MVSMQAFALLAALMLCLMADCPGGGTTRMPNNPSGSPLPPGRWGGDGVVMQVDEDGARLEFACAHGAIDEPIVADADGRFDLPGTYAPERMGPAPEEGTAARRARYRGEVSGDELRLAIGLVDPDELVGTFTLVRGRAVRLVKCQ